jgi:acyl-CoA synthetase (AMP-forming)/AMP-acid ligase II
MIAHAVFEWAGSQPEKTAVDYNGETWSYLAFSQAIARARGHFHALGLEGGGVVVVAAGRLRDWWVAALALRSLGLTTICVEFATEIEQLHIRGLRAVAASEGEDWEGLEEICAALGVPRVAADAGGAEALRHDPATPPGGHIMLSSGTTGVRKKVLMDPSFEAAHLHRRMRGNGINHDSVVSVVEFQPGQASDTSTRPRPGWPGARSSSAKVFRTVWHGNGPT